MKKISRLTIFPKLVLAFMIILIPLVSISLMMNIRSERLVRNEITKSMQSKAQYYLKALEYDFGPLVTLQQQYTLDDDINSLAYSSIIMSNEQYTEAIKNVQKKLLILKNMNAYVEDAFVNIPALDRKISAAGFNTISQEEAQALNQMIDPYESPFLVFRDRLWLSTPYPNSSPIGKGYTIGMEISGSAIRQSLSSFQINGEGGAVLMDQELGWSEAGGTVPGNLTRTRQMIQSRLDAGFNHGYEIIRENQTRFYAFYEKSERLGLTLVIFVNEDSFIGPIKQYGEWLWWISIASVIIVLLFAYWLYRTIHNPLRQLVSAFKSLEKGDLSFQFRYKSRDEFNYLYLQFNRTVSRLQELINEVYIQKYQVKEAELKQLQSQINPHFLYNSFFNLYRLAKLHETEKVISFSKNLGDYFKYVTGNSSFVPLEQEVGFCRAYVAIQTIRFEEHIRVEFSEIPDRISRLLIPKLFLQPLVENCYHHGLEDRVEQGYVQIRFKDCGEFAQISVEDNGTSLTGDKLMRIQALLSDPVQMSDSTGLRNVQQRIRLNFGSGAGLFAEKGGMGGLRITAVIPIKEETG